MPLGSASSSLTFFFFNDTATTEIYTLSLHDALPISSAWRRALRRRTGNTTRRVATTRGAVLATRSEEHTSELQSLAYLVCRLLLEKKTTRSAIRNQNRHRWRCHCRSLLQRFVRVFDG